MNKGTMMFGGQFNHRVIVDPVRNIVAKYGNPSDPGSGLESTKQEFSRRATRGESAIGPGLPPHTTIEVPYLDRRQTAGTPNRSASVPRPERAFAAIRRSSDMQACNTARHAYLRAEKAFRAPVSDIFPLTGVLPCSPGSLALFGIRQRIQRS
jgi:hypothetical protein